MFRRHIFVERGEVSGALVVVEESSPAVVEEDDTHVLAYIAVPESVHIIEEGEVANEQETEFLCAGSMADKG